MVTFKTNGTHGEVELQLPTSLADITVEQLNDMASNIEVADNYSLIAVCYREKLSKIVLAVKQNNSDMQTSVVPVFVKGGYTDNNYCRSLKAGDTLIVAGSDIALGFHAVSPKNKLTMDYFVKAIEGDKDAYGNAIKVEDYCYFVEFKIIPNTAIHGNYTR